MLKKALLWKEWTSTRTTMFGFLGLLLFVYPICAQLGVPGSLDRIKSGATFLALAIGFALGILALAGERKHNTMDFLLAMPFSRQEIFFSKVAYHLACIVAINFLNYLALLAVWASNAQVKAILDIAYIHSLFLVLTVATCFTFAFTLIFTTIAGSRLAAGVFTGIFFFFPVGFAGLAVFNLSAAWPELNQYADQILKWATKISPLFLTDSQTIQSHCPWILAVSLLLIRGADLLFRRNPMEKNGQILAFPQLEPVLKVGVSICSALLAGSLYSFAPILHLLVLIVGAVIGWAIVALLIRRSQAQV